MRKSRDPLDRSARKWLTYRRILSTKGVFREEGVAFTRSSPIKKAKQPHTSFPLAPSARSFVRALVPACSYIPAPVPHPRVFGLPPAHNPRLRFFVHPQRSLRALAFSVRPDPVWRMVPSVRPSTRPFTMPQPRFALSQFRLPRVGFLSRSFGSLEPVSRRCPYIYLARVPRPLLRHPL